MKIIGWLIGLFAPREANLNLDADGNKIPDGGGDPEGRPDWCPEKFYDKDLGAGVLGVRSEVMAKSFVEIEGKMREGKEALTKEINADRLAQAPEKYEIKLPEFKEGEIPEGVEITLKDDDPIAQWFMGFAKEQGLSQNQFDEAVNQYIKLEVAGLPNIQDQIKLLGDYGADRMQRVNTWLEKTLPEPQFKSIQTLLTDAASVEALETLMKGHSAIDFDSEGGGSAMTLEELQQMQKDPRYWRDNDKPYIEKVAAGYRRLYNR